MVGSVGKLIYYTNFNANGITENTIFSLDLETSSGWIFNNDGVVREYDKTKTDEELNESIKVSLCYIWQFSVDNIVYYGRELKQLLHILEELDTLAHANKWKIYVYAHNLAFEFQFLRSIMTPNNVLALSTRRPINADFVEFPCIQFRCSFMLTRRSLAKLSEETPVKKLDGALYDYNKLRTPNTKLSEYELQYAENDCLVLYYTIKGFLEQYKTVKNIPLTQTGIVRREFKRLIRSNKKNLEVMAKMQPRNYNEYVRWLCCFGGGDCHANILYIGQLLENIYSYDFASSYPYRIVANKYPNTPFRYHPFKYEKLDIEKDAFLLHLELTNVQAKRYNHSLSKSRCLKVKNARCDNGRIITAERVELWCTELDYITYRKTYHFEEKVLESYKSDKSYLPREMILETLKLYQFKTSYKNVPTKETEYGNAKERINALYGMSVTKPIQDTFEVAEKWKQKHASPEELDEKFSTEWGKPSSKRFSSFIHGVYITAYARYALWNDCIIPNDKNVVYFDTDSVKSIKKIDFTDYNKDIEKALETVMKYYNITEYTYKPKTPKGQEKMLGEMVFEECYKTFITQGAKRYAVEVEHNGKTETHITVAGVSKEYGKTLDIKQFEDGYVFDRDNEDVEKHMMLLSYIDNEESNLATWNKGQDDEYTNTDYKYGINMRNRGYTMGLTSEFSILLENYKQVSKRIIQYL